MAVIPQLNKFTYLAMSTKITTLTPTELRTLCSDLISYNNFSNYDNNHSVYSVACYNQALKRMKSISKLKATKEQKLIIGIRLREIELFTNPTTELTDLTNLFSEYNNTVYWYPKTIQQIKDINTLLEKQDKFINKLKLEIRLSSLNALSTSNQILIHIKLIKTIIGPNAKILEYLPKALICHKNNLNRFDINELKLITQAITEVREEYDAEYKRSTTN